MVVEWDMGIAMGAVMHGSVGGAAGVAAAEGMWSDGSTERGP